MRKIKEDMKDMSRWKRCSRKHTILSATYRVSGTVYCNPLDMSKSVADENTPIVFMDDSGVYWTEAVCDLQNNYVMKNGDDIGDEVLSLMRTGELIQVRPKTDEELWVFKVDVKTYRWDCPFGANASGVHHGDGDYLVCSGDDRPDFKTLKLVRNAAFKRFYIERSV